MCVCNLTPFSVCPLRRWFHLLPQRHDDVGMGTLNAFFQVCSGGGALRRRLVRLPATVAASAQAECVAITRAVCVRVQRAGGLCLGRSTLTPGHQPHPSRCCCAVRRYGGVRSWCWLGCTRWSYSDLRRKVRAADCWCGTAFLSCSSRPAPWASMCGEFAAGLVFAQVVTVHSLVFASFLPL